MVLDKCFVSTCPAASTAAAIFLSDTAFQHVSPAPGLLLLLQRNSTENILKKGHF